MRLVLLTLVVLAAGCGVDPGCNPSNCTGCCSVRGTCVAGTSATECGGGGEACSSCGAKFECGDKACRVKCVCSDGCCGADGGCIRKTGSVEVFSASMCPTYADQYCAPCPLPAMCRGYRNTGGVTLYECR